MPPDTIATALQQKSMADEDIRIEQELLNRKQMLANIDKRIERRGTHGHDVAPSPTGGDVTVRAKSGMRGNSGLLQSPGVSEEEAIQMAIYTSQQRDRQQQPDAQPCASECQPQLMPPPYSLMSSPHNPETRESRPPSYRG